MSVGFRLTSRKTRLALIILALMAASLGLFVTWVTFQPPPGRPNVSVMFLGYTNDSSGTRLARFAVANHSDSAIALSPRYSLEAATPTGSAWQTNDAFLGTAGILPASTTNTVSIPAPVNLPLWRISLLVYPEVGPGRIIKGLVAYALLRIGVPARYRSMFYGFDGPWVDAEK